MVGMVYYILFPRCHGVSMRIYKKRMKKRTRGGEERGGDMYRRELEKRKYARCRRVTLTANTTLLLVVLHQGPDLGSFASDLHLNTLLALISTGIYLINTIPNLILDFHLDL